MLYSADGYTPIANEEIQRRLAQITPGLSLQWVNGPTGGYWAVLLKWEPGDKRYAMIQRGEMSPDSDRDMVAMLPPDCSVDQAYGYIVNNLRSHNKESIRKLLDRVQEYNRKHQDEVWEASHAEALNMVEVMGYKMFDPKGGRVVKVGQALGATPAARGKKASEL